MRSMIMISWIILIFLFPLCCLADSVSIVSHTPFSGSMSYRPGFSTENGSIRPYDTTNNLAYQGNGFAQAAVVQDTLPGYPSIHQPQFANDGLYGNGASWIGAGGYRWLKIDLGRVVQMSRLEFGRDRLGYFNDRAPGQFTIAVAMTDNVYAHGDSSNDSVEYTTVFNSADFGFAGAFNPGDTVRSVFSQAITAKFVKITFSGVETCIDEIEIFGTVPEPSTILSIVLALCVYFAKKRF
ncbi:MAG: discoidin domain-containing protein [Candidatus Brocadiae bacterium]|nr:discoidin domain-containing protein [Candidatus Brocadiia bacterium]